MRIEDFANFKEKDIDTNHRKIKRRINRLNKVYEKYNLHISFEEVPKKILDEGISFKVLLINKYDSENVGNFFFYPSHRIIEYDGKKEVPIGFRVNCIRTYFFVVTKYSFNVSNEMLKNGKWLINDTFEELDLKVPWKIDYCELMESLFEGSRKHITVSKVNGWVQGNNGQFHYIPVTKPKNIFFDSATKQMYKHKVDKNLDEKTAFNKIYELLDITDKEITIPLLAFTVISALRRFSSFNEEKPGFLVCLYNENEEFSILLSNLFCKIFGRSNYLYDIDSELHGNNFLIKDLGKKIRKLRDAVYISKFNKKGDLKYFIDQIELPTGLLLISKDFILHDSVVVIDSGQKSFNPKLIDEHKDNPQIFSTWFNYFIKHIQKELYDDEWGLAVEGNIDNLYSSGLQEIESAGENVVLDSNKLRHYAWLMTGFAIFMNFGYEINGISKESYDLSLNEAAEIFYKLSSQSTKNSPIQHQDDVLEFLKTIDLILCDDYLLQYEESSRGRKNKGKEESKDERENIEEDKAVNAEEEKKKSATSGLINATFLYLKNEELFEYVKLTLEEKYNYTLRLSSGDIYQNLHNKSIVIKPENATDGWARIHKKKRHVKYDLKNMRQYLEANGQKLHFLKNK